MNIDGMRRTYCENIDTLTTAITHTEQMLMEDDIDSLKIKERIFDIINESIRPDAMRSLDDLRRYIEWVRFFQKQYGKEDSRTQAGKLFQFRPERFTGDIDVQSIGIAYVVQFSNPEDMLYARFSQRREHFSQSDQGAWFFRIVTIDNHRIPVCSFIEWCDEQGTKIHELTHLRNNIIGMNYYARWGWRDVYEVYTYDDLQDEILAFFSEGYKRAQVQITLLHDTRYHFYRRMEGWGKREEARYTDDVIRFVSVANKIKRLRNFRFLIDLAIIPIHKWPRYLRYLENQK